MSIGLLKIRIYGDPCLRQKSEPVTDIGPGERMLIESMVKTMHEAKGVGLAAPQVGINQRLFVIDVGEGPMAVINPELSNPVGKEEYEEGCLSIPEVTVKVERPQQITVKFLDEEGQPREMTCDELTARVIQHETDHLDGKLIVDYASADEKAQFKDQLEALEKESNSDGADS